MNPIVDAQSLIDVGFNAVTGFGFGVFAAFIIGVTLTYIGKFLIAYWHAADQRKQHEKKAKGLPQDIDLADFHELMNQALDRLMSEPVEKIKHGLEPDDDGEIIWVELPDEERGIR